MHIPPHAVSLKSAAKADKIVAAEKKNILCYIYSNVTSAGGLQGGFTLRWRRIECLGKHN